jgi:hypothetical protein
MRDHDVTALTGRELEQTRRDLAASLALARPGSPARVPILTQMTAIDAELACRPAAAPGGRQLWPRSGSLDTQGLGDVDGDLGARLKSWGYGGAAEG